MYFQSLTDNKPIKKNEKNQQNYRNIYLPDMFWKIVVLKIDKILLLKINNKKYV